MKLLPFVLAVTTLNAADFPKSQITNGPLQVTVYLPNPTSGMYRGTRFDWAGVIGSLRYKGHEYYGQWFNKVDPAVRDFVYKGNEIIASACTAITGPAEEFQLPLGYDDAQPGGTFIKIGVGVLRRPDAAKYDAFRLYEIVNGGKWTVLSTANTVEVTQELTDAASGYGYIYRKKINLTNGKPEMVLEHSLKNTGRRPILSNVYNHNFLALDKQPPGPDFKTELPFQLKAIRPPAQAVGELKANAIVYRKPLTGEVTLFTLFDGFSDQPSDYDIRIENRKVRAGLRIQSDRPLSRAMFWSIRAVLSIEPFIAIDVKPNAEFTWTTTYTYYETT